MNSTVRSLRTLSIIFFSVLSSVNIQADSMPAELSMIQEEIKNLKETLGEHGSFEMPVHEFNLKELLCRMIDQCPAPSSMLRDCCKKLEQGQITLTLSELLEIMPELVLFASEQYPYQGTDGRAARPDAPPVTANDAVVGKSGCDLTQVLALLAMIKKNINMLKQLICEKFAFTWTILEEIQDDIFNCCTLLEAEIFNTKTVLCDKFVGTWTILEDIQDDIFNCCTLLEAEIFNTKTVLCDKFVGTWTILEEIQDDIFNCCTLLEAEIFNTKTVLCDKFVGTWTILEEIQDDIFNCCTLLEAEIFNTKTVLCDKFVGTWTILEGLLFTFSCAQCTAISTPTTITTPGCYCLAEDIFGSIAIDADRVILDLNNHQVSGAVNNIDIANNRSDIFIKNGYITAATGNGINIGESAVNVQLDNISFIGNNLGVFFNGTSTSAIECVKIENCLFRGNTNGAIDGSFVRNSSIQNVVCKENTGTFVIQISSGQNISFNNVKVNENVTTFPVTIQVSSNITFFNCQVNNNSSAGSLNGINLDNNNNVKLNACMIDNNTVTTDFIGMNITNSNDIKASGICINQNNAGTSAVGILADTVNKLNVYNVQANNNTSTANFVYGFFNNNSSDCSYIESHALANGAGNSDTSGFRSENSTKTIYQDCFANDNVATNTAIGFDLRSSSTSCVLSCIAKRNTATGVAGGEVGRGIYLVSSPNCYVERNLVAANTGTLSVGIDITFTTPPFNTTVFANQSQDHILNYLTTPANILTVFYTRSLATVSATPTPLDNIDII